MIARYTRPAMGGSGTNTTSSRSGSTSRYSPVKRRRRTGHPPGAVDVIRAKASFDVGRIEEIEREVKHDVIAFLTNVASTSVLRPGTFTWG